MWSLLMCSICFIMCSLFFLLFALFIVFFYSLSIHHCLFIILSSCPILFFLHLLLSPILLLLHLLPLSHSLLISLCFPSNLLSSFSDSSHGVVVNNESSKSHMSRMLLRPRALDSVTYALKGVSCPFNGVPRSADK